MFKVIKTNKYLVGNNIISNRFTIINGEVDLQDLNLSLDSFKVKYKTNMLS